MKKSGTKKIIAAFYIMLLIFPSIYSVNAANLTVAATEIPDRMAPETRIEFVTDTEYTILEGGEYEDSAEYAQTFQGIEEDMRTLEEIAITETYEEWSRGFDSQIDWSETIYEEAISPKAGMIITYADDGYILRIQNNSPEMASLRAACRNCGKSYLSNGSTSPNGTYTWGAHSNKLVVTSGEVKGTGRFTTFADKIGQANHNLVKGDVATRYHVDNPSYGTKVICSANGYTREMTKYDVGCMPDGVLDIWKTGVEYFGKTYNSSLSINNGAYSYKR